MQWTFLHTVVPLILLVLAEQEQERLTKVLSAQAAHLPTYLGGIETNMTFSVVRLVLLLQSELVLCPPGPKLKWNFSIQNMLKVSRTQYRIHVRRRSTDITKGSAKVSTSPWWTFHNQLYEPNVGSKMKSYEHLTAVRDRGPSVAFHPVTSDNHRLPSEKDVTTEKLRQL